MAAWKKVIIGIVTTVGIAIALFAGGLAYLFSGMCGSDPYKSIASPSGKYKAVIYQFDCGAASGFSTQVSILEANDQLKAEAGNIFSASGHPEEVAPDVIWVSDNTLNIHMNAAGKTHRQVKAWGWPWKRINVTYN